MNIKIIINLILVASLSVINITGMDKKRKYAADDSDVSKKIKVDAVVLAKWAKDKELDDKLEKAVVSAKKEKEPVNLDFIKFPADLQKLVAEYLKNDWYLYNTAKTAENTYIDMLSFSTANNKVFLLMGNKYLSNVYDVLNKCFTDLNFEKKEDLSNRDIPNKKVKGILNEEDKEGSKYYLPMIDSCGDHDSDNHGFWVDETYFSKKIILSGIFSLSKCENYLAFANRFFLKIWDVSKFEEDQKKEISENNCIITYEFKKEKAIHYEADIKYLSFSDCGSYLVIVAGKNTLFCFICNIKTKSVMDLTDVMIEDLHSCRSCYSFAFSKDSKYLAIGTNGMYNGTGFIFKNRQNGFE